MAAKEKASARLVAEFTDPDSSTGVRYRLSFHGSQYYLERLETDRLGNARWADVDSWWSGSFTDKNNKTLVLLSALAEQLAAEREVDKKTLRAYANAEG